MTLSSSALPAGPAAERQPSPKRLKNGFRKKSLSSIIIDCPIYDYSIYDRTDKTHTVTPSRVILVEGILIFHEKALRDLMDIKLFVDADADVRILRRILRDVKERGRSLDSVITQYLGTVKPMHEAFVEPSKKYADIIIPEGGKNQVALDMVLNRVQFHLDSHDR